MSIWRQVLLGEFPYTANESQIELNSDASPHCQGHVCPSGAKCFHLSKGKCWFKGGESITTDIHSHLIFG